MGGVIWNVGSTYGRLAVNALYACGRLTVLATTFLINHFDLFGCAKSGRVYWDARTRKSDSAPRGHTATSGIRSMWDG